MRCKFCGTTLPDHAKFCPGCGKEIDNDRERHEGREASNIPEDAYYTKVIEESNEKTIDDTRIARTNNRNVVDDTRISRANNRNVVDDIRIARTNNRNVVDDTRITRANNRNVIDDARIARTNNRNVVDDTRISRANNKNTIDNTKTTNKQAAVSNTNKKNSKRKRRHKKISVRFIIVYLIVVLTGGFCLYRMGFPEKVVEMLSKQSSVPDSKKEISQKSDKKKNNEKKTGKATTEKKGTIRQFRTRKYKNKNKKTLESTESTLAYTDNSSMNVGACLSPEDYNTVTAKDDSFSFAYPKYLFNHSEVNEEGTSYTFSYKGNSASDSNEAELSVYTQENEGDPLQNARELYQNFSSEVYKKYFKMYPSRVDSSGMARTLIGASADSSEKTGVYIIAANDGKRDYILKFTYPDPDMTNDYNEIDYVVDCVYRFCSFSGGTYQPRSYQQFLDDNMGSKK